MELGAAQFLHEGGHLLREPPRRLRQTRRDDPILFFEIRIFDPEVQAPPLQCVVHFARAVRGEDDNRRLGCRDRSEFGNRDLVVGEESSRNPSNSSSARSISSISSTGSFSGRVPQRTQQWPSDQKRLGAQPLGRPRAVDFVARLEQTNLEQLPRVVPLV